MPLSCASLSGGLVDGALHLHFVEWRGPPHPVGATVCADCSAVQTGRPGWSSPLCATLYPAARGARLRSLAMRGTSSPGEYWGVVGQACGILGDTGQRKMAWRGHTPGNRTTVAIDDFFQALQYMTDGQC